MNFRCRLWVGVLAACAMASACGARSRSIGDPGGGPLDRGTDIADAGADGSSADRDEQEVVAACRTCCSLAIECEWRDDSEPSCVSDCQAFSKRVGRDAFEAAEAVGEIQCIDEPHTCADLDCAWLCAEQPALFASCDLACETNCAGTKRAVNISPWCHPQVASLLDCWLENPADCSLDPGTMSNPGACEEEYASYLPCTLP